MFRVDYVQSAWIWNNGMYRQDFCSALLKVIAVYARPNWESPRLPCLRWHMFGICHEAGGGAGRRGTTTSYCPHSRCGARL